MEGEEADMKPRSPSKPDVLPGAASWVIAVVLGSLARCCSFGSKVLEVLVPVPTLQFMPLLEGSQVPGPCILSRGPYLDVGYTFPRACLSARGRDQLREVLSPVLSLPLGKLPADPTGAQVAVLIPKAAATPARGADGSPLLASLPLYLGHQLLLVLCPLGSSSGAVFPQLAQPPSLSLLIKQSAGRRQTSPRPEGAWILEGSAFATVPTFTRNTPRAGMARQLVSGPPLLLERPLSARKRIISQTSCMETSLEQGSVRDQGIHWRCAGAGADAEGFRDIPHHRVKSHCH